MGKANAVAKDLRCSNGKYRMRVEPSQKRYDRSDEVAVITDAIAQERLAEADGSLATFTAEFFE